jgi:protoheme IX farnesyltransferase
MGGLVTTYGAGMAVPDWPNTYGYNLFLYPLASWLHVWDVFLEHSHRLIGAGVGMITIALAVVLWRRQRRTWMRWMGLVALAGVLGQGTLGGLRVIEDALLLAKVHGCTAPVFFALTTAMVAWTSRPWVTGIAAPHSSARLVQWLAWGPSAGIYLQIALGAQLRHLSPKADVSWFELWVWLHLIVAGLVWIGVIAAALFASRRLADQPRIARRAWLLLWLFLVQLILGAATWLTNFGWPAWFTSAVWEIEYTVVAGGRLQALLTTAHVAAGSLCLVTASSLALWSQHSLRPAPTARAGAQDTIPFGAKPGTERDSIAGHSGNRGLSPMSGLLVAIRGYWQLIRPRILGLVLLTLVITAIVSRGSDFSWVLLGHAVAGSTLVILGAIALNARLEYARDVRMPRTAARPLPAGRLTTGQVTWFAVATSVLGMVYLWGLANGWTTALAIASWLIYVWIYTPLKLFTAWQTPIGAVAGAMPVLLGSAAVGHPLSATALALFGMVYFWQFPHAMAVAWLYRDDFAAGDLRVATVVDPSGRIAASISLLGAFALLPISLVPTLIGTVGWGYGVVALAMGISYLAAGLVFFMHRNDRSARQVLLVSLAYIPVVFVAILLAAA